MISAKEASGISAAVVMYGDEDDVYKCLQSLEKHIDAENFELFLIDNASPNGALQNLKKLGVPACVKVLELANNKGFGAGHNQVLPLLKSKYHAVINPDILLFDDALVKMANWLDENPDVAIATPRLVFPNGDEQHIGKRRPALLPIIARQTKFSFLEKYNKRYVMMDEDLTKPIDVEFCSGSFFMVRTEIMQKIGGFDEGYFMYVEDADITQKALLHGRAVFLPQVTVAHAWHRKAHGNVRQFLWQIKSMLRYFRKWGFKFKN